MVDFSGADGITTAERRGMLPAEGRVEADGVSLRVLPPAFRISLRARPDAVHPLNVALSIGLPTKPKSSAREGDLGALWLGPDEWLIIDAHTDRLSSLRAVDALHSAVDISHRNTAIEVSGPHAADAIAGGCPQNLSIETFPVGACSRTVLGKAEVVLWRTAEDTFRVECWRSFAPYVWTFLATSARDAAA